jgi:hypothetical protein
MHVHIAISRAERRRGAALVASLAVVLFVAVLTAAFLRVSLTTNREHTDRLQSERAVHLAEAAIAEALNAMRFGGTGEVASEAEPARFAGGLVWVEATDLGSFRTRLVASAMTGSARETVELIAHRQASLPVPTGIFSNQPLEIQSSTIIDSFDPADGTYADQLAASPGGYVGDASFIASNGDITVENSAEVQGDVAPGPGMDALIADPDSVSGSTDPSNNPMELLPVTTPAIPSSGPLWVPFGTSQTLPPGDVHYSALAVGVGSSLTITGPARVVLDSFHVSSNANVTFDATGGPIEIYATGTFELSSNSDLLTPGPASNLTLFCVGGPGQVVELDSNSEFHGVIYGPEATISVASNFEIFGAVMAEDVQLAANVAIHYDESLAATGTVYALVVVDSWKPEVFPIPAALRDRRPPLMALGLSAGDLPELNESAPAPPAGEEIPELPETAGGGA